MNHSSNESLSKLEFKNDFISDFAKNKLVEVVRVTNELLLLLLICDVSIVSTQLFERVMLDGHFKKRHYPLGTL